MAERPERQAGHDLEVAAAAEHNEDYVNSDDLFYWMDDSGDSDIPLAAIWMDIPTGCRFCC